MRKSIDKNIQIGGAKNFSTYISKNCICAAHNAQFARKECMLFFDMWRNVKVCSVMNYSEISNEI